MRSSFAVLLTAISVAFAGSMYVDPDSDCFYTPYDTAAQGSYYPVLFYLSCTGATRVDLDSLRPLADSLGLILASCHQSRNHRDLIINDFDIMATYEKLVRDYPVDPDRIFICGFSGQAVQAMYAQFKHPRQFRGVFAVCGHEGAMPSARLSDLKGKTFYLMTREEDWNLKANRSMYNQLLTSGVPVTLFVGPGPHGPPGLQDFYRAIAWLLEASE
jgi:predicted peptidase